MAEEQGSKMKYEGWLLKLATSISALVTWNGWRKRWCVLHRDKFEWYANKTDSEPRGVIAFGPDCIVEHAGVVRNRYYTFKISVGQKSSISFAAETYELASQWVNILNRKIQYTSSLYHAGNKLSPGASMSFLIDMEYTKRSSRGVKSSFHQEGKLSSALLDRAGVGIGGAGSQVPIPTPALNDEHWIEEDTESNDEDIADDDEEDTDHEDGGGSNYAKLKTTAASTTSTTHLNTANASTTNMVNLSHQKVNDPAGIKKPQLLKSKSRHAEFILGSNSLNDVEAVTLFKEASRRSTFKTLVQNGEWNLVSLRSGLRIFYQNDPLSRIGAPGVFKSQTSIPFSPFVVFNALMDLSNERKSWDSTFEKGEVLVETLSHQSSVVQWCTRDSKDSSFGIPIKSRSILATRHWRRDETSQSYIIMFRPCIQKDSSLYATPKNSIAAKLWFGAIYISADSSSLYDNEQDEADSSIVTFGLQIDLQGWLKSSSISTNISGIADEYVCEMVSTLGNLTRHLELTSKSTKLDKAAFFIEGPQQQQQQQLSSSSSSSPVREEIIPSMNKIDTESTPTSPPPPPPVTTVTTTSGSISNTPEIVELDYSYDVPLDSTSVIPREKSKTGKSAFWDSGVDGTFWKIRGPTYLDDKVKVESKTAAMEVVALKLQFRNDPISNISAYPGELIDTQHKGRKDRPFLIVLNFLVPSVGNWTTYFARRRGQPHDPVFERMLKNFIERDDEYRNSKFKIIPGITEGPWVVKRGVGNQPAILGKKITCNYFKGDNCFEIEVNVGSSKVAGSLLSLVKGYSQNLTIDLAFLFESHTPDELPERILGAIRCASPDLSGV